jgi:hypothetical protein
MRGFHMAPPLADTISTCCQVALEKGFSQVDWLKLCRTHPDLTGATQLLHMAPTLV